MGTRVTTWQLELSFDATTKKTRAHAERETSMREKSCGTEMTAPFKWDLVIASKGDFFFPCPSAAPDNSRDRHCHELWSRLNTTEKASWLTAVRVLEPSGLRTRPSKGCRTENGKLQSDEGCASVRKNSRCASAVCSRMKEGTTRWRVRKASGGHDYMTVGATVLQDKMEEWAQLLTCRKLHRNGQSSTKTNKGQISTEWLGSVLWHDSWKRRAAVSGHHHQKTNGCRECCVSGKIWWMLREQERDRSGHGGGSQLRTWLKTTGVRLLDRLWKEP